MSTPSPDSRRVPPGLALSVYFAVLLLAVWCSPTVIPAEGGNDRTSSSLEPPAVPERLYFPALRIRRDPFTPSVEIEAGNDPTLGDDAGGIVLPPNTAAAVGENAGLRGSAPELRAVILGTVPKALVDVAGRSILVGVGSPLLSSTVTAIRRDSILLEDGESLHFSGKHP